jgi:hypothetical protein
MLLYVGGLSMSPPARPVVAMSELSLDAAQRVRRCCIRVQQPSDGRHAGDEVLAQRCCIRSRVLREWRDLAGGGIAFQQSDGRDHHQSWIEVADDFIRDVRGP